MMMYYEIFGIKTTMPFSLNSLSNLTHIAVNTLSEQHSTILKELTKLTKTKEKYLKSNKNYLLKVWLIKSP
jgi:hypothetical protein